MESYRRMTTIKGNMSLSFSRKLWDWLIGDSCSKPLLEHGTGRFSNFSPPDIKPRSDALLSRVRVTFGKASTCEPNVKLKYIKMFY